MQQFVLLLYNCLHLQGHSSIAHLNVIKSSPHLLLSLLAIDHRPHLFSESVNLGLQSSLPPRQSILSIVVRRRLRECTFIESQRRLLFINDFLDHALIISGERQVCHHTDDSTLLLLLLLFLIL